jgi:hypothetical protein
MSIYPNDEIDLKDIETTLGTPSGESVSEDIQDSNDDLNEGIANAETNIRGADSDTLKTLSDQADAIQSDTTALKEAIVDTNILQNIFDDTENASSILNQLPDGGALTSIAQDSTVAKEATLAVPAIDASGNDTIRDIIGNRDDTTASTSLVGWANQISGQVTDVFNEVQQFSGSYNNNAPATYTNAGGEQVLTTLVLAGDRVTIQGIWLDLVNLTTSGTVRLYYKIDGTNYRLSGSFPFDSATDSDGFFISLNMGILYDFKITYEENSDEGADRAIPISMNIDTRP